MWSEYILRIKHGQNIQIAFFCYDNERTICSHQKLTKHCEMIPCNLTVSF